MKSDRKIRVLISKTGLDGHDRGAKVVTYFLRNAGMEVIYLGQFQTPESIVKAAIEEGIDVVGLSCLSGEHMSFVPALLKQLEVEKLRDILIIMGGTIPRKEIPLLKDMGVNEIFEAGSPLKTIIAYIRNNVSVES